MMPMPKVQRTEPDKTAYELMEAASMKHSSSAPLFNDKGVWPGVVEQTVVLEKTICWWGGSRRP
jgi:hypothetical protein